MSQEHHSPIAAGTNGVVASVNSRFSTLDDGIVGLRNGTNALRGLTLNGMTATTLTIVSGVLTIPTPATQVYYVIQSETGTADDLIAISGGYVGRVIVLQAASGHTITVKNGSTTNSISIPGEAVVLDSTRKTLTLISGGASGTSTPWRILGDHGSPLFEQQSLTSASQKQYNALVVPPFTTQANQVGANDDAMRLAFMPSGDARSSWSVRCQGGTTHVSGVTLTVSGTGAAANDDIDVFNAYPSAAGVGALAGLASANFTQWRIYHYPIFAGRFKTHSDITNTRIYVGLSAAAAPNSDTLSNNFIGFRWCPVAGDSGFRAVTYNGTQTVSGSDLTPAVTASTVYDFRIVCVPLSGMYITITDPAGTYTTSFAAGFAPDASADLGFVCNLVTPASGARTLNVARLYGEHGGGR
jgi:hypothetical protein